MSQGSREGGDRLGAFLRAKSISPFVSNELMVLIESPISRLVTIKLRHYLPLSFLRFSPDFVYARVAA